MKFLLDPILIGLLVVFVGAYAIHKLLQKREQKHLQRAKENKERTLVRQQELGEKLLNALTESAKKNRISNMLPDGTMSKNISPLAVDTLYNHAGIYSVLASVSDTSVINGRIWLLQFDIDLFNKNPAKQVYVLGGPFHDESYFTEQEFEFMIPIYARSLEHYAYFPETQTKHVAALGWIPLTFLDTFA